MIQTGDPQGKGFDIHFLVEILGHPRTCDQPDIIVTLLFIMVGTQEWCTGLEGRNFFKGKYACSGVRDV